MDTFAAIADERRTLAALVAGFTDTQLQTPSLCRGWRVHDVVAHLVVPLAVNVPRFALAMLTARGSFDRANIVLARAQARRPVSDLAGVLRDRADSRFTPPGSGPEAPLTDLLVHGLDIRWPLGLLRDIPANRLTASLTFLTARPVRHVVPTGVPSGLRFEADDLDWAHGDGPVVRGRAETLLLAITGRPVALDHLDGDGVALLRSRLT